MALAGFISGTVALLCAFLTHRFITWRDRSVSRVTILKFFTFTGLGMWILRPVLLSVFIHFNSLYRAVHTITSNLHLPFSYDFVAKTGAFGFMVVLILIYNFLTYDRFVFHAKTNTSSFVLFEKIVKGPYAHCIHSQGN